MVYMGRGEAVIFFHWKKRILRGSSSQDRVAPTQSALKYTRKICANSLALLGISLAKAYSPALISNCHVPTPTLSTLHLVNN